MTGPALHIVPAPRMRTLKTWRLVSFDPRPVWVERYVTVPDCDNPAELRRALAETEKRIDGK